ncbi:hypothetical protein LCGC14_0906750 [marine sediment metagenome]|uniref:Uncharacterized protein n=1 Tax=marine sediment metagenome TaxID=412755 RepID=A0A0F9RDV7_9ZZZZ
MTNKYRNLEPLRSGEDSARFVQMGMDGGFRGDVSPRQLAPDETSVLDDIRFERSAIRKDFGWQAIGTAAATRVLGLIEHKFIDGQLQFHRIVRLTRDGSNFCALEVWDGANWILTDTSVVIINDVYLSVVSAQGNLFIAEGSQILRWGEELAKIDQENDFPASNVLDFIQASTVATVTPGAAGILDYDINYDVIIRSSPTQDTLMVVEFLHGSVVLGEEGFFASRAGAFPVIFNDQKFSFTRQIDDLDLLVIRIKEAEGGGTTLVTDIVITVAGGPDPDIIGDKSSPQPDLANKYKFFLEMIITAGCTAVVGIYADKGGGSFVQQTTVAIPSDGGTASEIFIATISGMTGENTRFGLSIESVDCGSASFTGPQDVQYTRTNADVEVHGHNKAVNADDPAGVFYQTTGAAVTVFVAIDPAPAAKFVIHAFDRLIALHDGGDTQSFAWTRDGILTAFEGTGSGQVFLTSPASDPIDSLQGAAILNSNFLAVFRKRSIMRAFETGNVQLAVGIVQWIENVGTNCPFSIRNVRGGVIFLGHDNMVYFLTEQGLTAIGLPIHQELIENLTGDLSLVDSGYDPTFAEYYLGIPVAAAATITRIWVFDVDRFLDKQEKVWRRKPLALQRFATAGVSVVE